MGKITAQPVLTPADDDLLTGVDVSEAAPTLRNKKITLLSLFNFFLSKIVFPVYTGWASYSDTDYTSGSPLAVSATTETVLPNNASAIVDDQKPSDIKTFWFAAKLSYINLTGTFEEGETITGGTSGATATLIEDSGFLIINDVSGTFVDTETVTGGTSGATVDLNDDQLSGGVTGRNGDNLDVMIYFKAVPSNNDQYLDIWIDITGGTGSPANLAELYKETFAFPKGVGVERGILYALPSAYTLGTWQSNSGVVKIYTSHSLDIYDIVFNFDRSHKAI